MSNSAMAANTNLSPSTGGGGQYLPPFHGLGRRVAAKSLQARLYNMRKVKR